MSKSIRNTLPFFFPCLLLLLGASGFLSGAQSFRRGDANADAKFNLSDPIHTLTGLFLGGPPPACEDAADANDDGILNISDPIYSLLYLFAGGMDLPAPSLRCGVDPTDDALGCAAFEPCAFGDGETEFSTPLSGAPGIFDGRAEDGATPVAGPAPPAAPAPEEERTIEEADIYRLEGATLFNLNYYRGLQVIDLSDLDHPRLIGRAPIFGYPREMYVRGTRAYVLVSDYYAYWREASVTAPVHGFYGSQLRIVDVADPRRPLLLGGIDVEGEVVESRIVGDVLYLVANRYPWYRGYPTEDTEDMTQVLSVDIAEPADIRVVDRRDFPRDGWEHHVHVTAQAIYLASSGWIYDDRTGGSYQTRIRYVDISDPRGAIALRGEATVDGRVHDRWGLDEYQGVLRVASGEGWGNGDVHLTTFSVADPDRLVRLGRYTLNVNEQLTAARFDGARGYLVSYRNIDPLFVFDLADPARPQLLGELEMTGWLDFIVPLGDRLVALGHEDIQRPDGGRDLSLAVSLIDAGAAGPRLLSRVALDGVWGSVPAKPDDFAKVFRVLPDAGLILFPFQAWSPEDYRHVGGVQLVDFDRDALALRGLIAEAGWVERGVPYDESTVLTLSSTLLQVADIADRDHPRLRGRLELARNVQDFDLLAGGHAVQLAGDWYLGDTELIVTPAGDPNATDPVARLRVPSPYGRMFRNGDLVYLASLQEVTDDQGAVTGRVTEVQVVDFTDPAQPRRRGSVTLPEEVWPGYGRWYWGWGDEAVLVAGTTLAFHRYPVYWWWGCLACDARDGAPVPIDGAEEEHRIHLVDLADPDAPVVASTVVLKDEDWAWGLNAAGSTLYLSTYRSFVEDDRWLARYFLHAIEVANPAAPEVRPPVNIPGMFIAAEAATPYFYTHETWWDQETQETRTFLHALALDGDQAVLQSSVEVEGYLNSVQLHAGALVATSSRWEYVPVDGVVTYKSYNQLLTVDVSVPRAIRLAGRADVPDYAYLQEVEAGRAFLGSGPGIFTYLVEDLANPVFEQFFRTQGWAQSIVVRGDRAYVPSGYHGVQVLEFDGD
jgi:hypothetical protein